MPGDDVAEVLGRLRADLHAITGWHTVGDILRTARRAPERVLPILERAADHAVDVLIATDADGDGDLEVSLAQASGALLELENYLRAVVGAYRDRVGAVLGAWGWWVGDGFDGDLRALWVDEDAWIPLPPLKIEAMRAYARFLGDAPPFEGEPVADRAPDVLLGDDARPSWASADEWDALVRFEIARFERQIAGALADRRGIHVAEAVATPVAGPGLSPTLES